MTASLEAAREACALAGLASSAIRPLHEHATAVYLHEGAGIVVRVSESARTGEAACRAVAVTRWLAGQGFAATEPARGLDPAVVAGWTVTFWRHYPQHDRPGPAASALGRLLGHLHQLPSPPVPLPVYQPLGELAGIVEASTALTGEDRGWLLERRGELITAYGELRSVLGDGFIHGDAYPGNTLWDGDRAILGDWDEVATGPRELDLANTYQGARFGRTAGEMQAFAAAYGHDITRWPGHAILVELRSLHTLGSFIKLADTGRPSAQEELAYRIRTLKDGDSGARWHAAT